MLLLDAQQKEYGALYLRRVCSVVVEIGEQIITVNIC